MLDAPAICDAHRGSRYEVGGPVVMSAGPRWLPPPADATRIYHGHRADDGCGVNASAGCDVFIAIAAAADYIADPHRQKIKKCGDALTGS